MSLLSKPELVQMAVQIAQEHALDPALVCAHIDVRSAWHSGAVTAAPASYLLNSGLDQQEAAWRAVQWGLMAISGEFARSQGYRDRLDALLEPVHNIREGCRIFRSLAMSKSDPIEGMIQALLEWNHEAEAGREYATRTLRKLEPYRVLLARLPLGKSMFPDDGKTDPLLRSQSANNLLLEVAGSMPTQSQP